MNARTKTYFNNSRGTLSSNTTSSTPPSEDPSLAAKRAEDFKRKFGQAKLPAQKVYTGNNMLGIATMHKSNAVPVFSAESAEDISRMK